MRSDGLSRTIIGAMHQAAQQYARSPSQVDKLTAISLGPNPSGKTGRRKI